MPFICTAIPFIPRATTIYQYWNGHPLLAGLNQLIYSVANNQLVSHFPVIISSVEH